MQKKHGFKYKKEAIKAFELLYRDDINRLLQNNISLKYSVVIKPNNIYIEISIHPTGTKNFYGKTRSVKIMKKKRGDYFIIISKKDKGFERFVNKIILTTQKRGTEFACEENIFNLILRIVQFHRYNVFPRRYKGHDIFIIYIVIFFIFGLILTILITKEQNHLAKRLGWR